MNETPRRPFYAEYAWAYELLIDRPVHKECAAMAAWLSERGVLPGAEILDAGCGTGRYAAELARRGYRVQGIDRSPEMIDVARRSIGEHQASMCFAVGDILQRSIRRYDAILCRGVLNDLLNAQDREEAFAAFAQALRPAGVLILDVREWFASAKRAAREPIFRKSVATDRGNLTFTSSTELDPHDRRLLVSERHTLIEDGQECISEFQFVMQCWTQNELQSSLTRCGFERLAYFGAYDATVNTGSTDRLVAVASLAKAAT